MDEIQQKLNNGEGLLLIDKNGIVIEITANELKEKTDPKWDKSIEDYQDRIEIYKNEYGENSKKYEEKMIEISNEINTTRVAQNPDYLLWQRYSIIYKPTKHDYKIVDDELVLLTNEEKLVIAKDKKKKEISEQLIKLYPEKLIDGTLQILKLEKDNEIDSLTTIQDIKNYKL